MCSRKLSGAFRKSYSRKKKRSQKWVQKTYPFSGPDILNAYTLFQHAKTFIMVGLEPFGSLPDFKKNADSLNNYFKSVDQSLYAIFNFSFFI